MLTSTRPVPEDFNPAARFTPLIVRQIKTTASQM